MELFRVIAIAAAPLGIVAAITLSDAWWFLGGLVASLFLYLTNEAPEGDAG